MRASAFRSTVRGSPSYGSPSGLTTSQIMRPTLASPARVGMSLKVEGSGIATMSDSSIALKPVIDEPSNPIPSSRAPATSDGVIAKLFRWPSMSVNQSSTYCTPSCSICSSTCLRAFGSDVARSLLSIIAISAAPPHVAVDSGATLYRQRPLHREHPRALDVAERAVQRLHRLVAALRPGDELADAALRGPAELRELQRPAEPATPAVPS